jgi:hypothetical protein
MNTPERSFIRKLRRGKTVQRQIRHQQEKNFGQMKVSRQDASVALSHQFALEEEVAELVKAAAAADSHSDLDLAHIRQTLDKMQTSVKGLAQHFSNSVDPSLYTEKEPSYVASEVFDMPELLEKILLNLPPTQILQAMAVNKDFKTTIEHSVKLQRELSLTIYKDHFRVPFENLTLPGLTFETELLGPGFPPHGNKYRVLLQIISHCDVKLGDRVRNMHISHPSPRQLVIQPICCGGWGVPNQVITNNNGIRLGDLVDACSAVRKLHLECFQAAPHCQRANGKFDVSVNCRVETLLDRSHPMAIEGRKWDREQAVADAAMRLTVQYSHFKRTSEYSLLPSS